MHNNSLNDWSTLQTLKEISYLRRESREKPLYNMAVLIDISIAVATICLDKLLTEFSWIIMFLLVFSIIVPIGYLLLLKFIRNKEISSKSVSPDVSLLINMFDNEICYNAITGQSMCEMIDCNANSANKNIRRYYSIESCYYLNKAVQQLQKFVVSYNDVVVDTKQSPLSVQLSAIADFRLVNILWIIKDTFEILLGKQDEDVKNIVSKYSTCLSMFNNIISNLQTVNLIDSADDTLKIQKTKS